MFEKLKDNILIFELWFVCLQFMALSEGYPHNPEVLLNDLKSPSDLLDYGDFFDCMDGGWKCFQVILVLAQINWQMEMFPNILFLAEI